MLLSIAGPTDLSLHEVNAAADTITRVAHPDANIIFGAVVDDALGEEVRVTVVAAGFDKLVARPPTAGSRAGCPGCWRSPSAAGTAKTSPSILADDDEDMDVFTAPATGAGDGLVRR